MSPRPQNDAKYWVEQAIAFYRACGRRIALAEFNNPNGQFVQDELYIFVLSPTGTMLAHGLNERFVGEEFIDIKDANGKSHIKEIVQTANAKGSGWVEHKWYHPALKRVLPKTTYFEKVDDLIICSAVYKVE